MAKKAVATFKKGDGRTYSKVIKMVVLPLTLTKADGYKLHLQSGK